MGTTKEIIRQNLVKLRKEKKMTQLELAEKLNYSDKAVSRWENGEVVPDTYFPIRRQATYGKTVITILQG